MSDRPEAVRGLSLPGASLSVLAVERERGDVVASASPERALAPASNTKLVTAALALDRLGPDYRYETRVVRDGPITDGVLGGDLALVGTGAPDVEAGDVATLAAEVSREIDRVEGDLLVDGTRFSGDRFGPGWTRGDQRYYYGAPSSAVALERNQVTVTVTLTEAGAAPSVSVAPDTPAVAVDADVTVDPGATTDDLGAYADPDDGTVTLRGRLPPDAGEVERPVPVLAPESHAGLAVRSALGARGVDVDGAVRVADDRRERDRKPTDCRRVVASVESAPVRRLVREMNVPSDNFVAEQLARTVARDAAGEGSWEAWESLVADHFASLGVDTVRVRDGSGLSRYNLVPARGLVAHLRWADDRPWAGAFFGSLPEPGEGTLSERLDGVSVAAKTGTITGTSALSGVVRRGGAEDVLFCVLHGGLTAAGSDAARETQDAFVRWLADAA